ncbi:ABC transporter substrate-binding protein [Novispirillum sp. DQ9]|uniref:ABC transporter substrate-binding protein n=1 Tax=Novispirillum sp. DQ9 TaxID=3398612 RepID=UPI003C7A2CE1
MISLRNPPGKNPPGKTPPSRRSALKVALALGIGLAAAGPLALAGPARAQSAAPIKVGLMLPYSGTYAALGEAITNGFNIALAESGGAPGGREIAIVTLDDESDPGKAVPNANKLIKGEAVDLLVGTVHSGVAMGMVRAVKDSGTLMIIPNAGAGPATGQLCSPNVFRTSFSNWQPAYPMGDVAYDKGYRKVVTMTWKYGAGEEAVGGFKEAFTKRGGEIVKEIYVPFPNVEFQANLTEIAALKPDAVFVFFAGGGAVKFVKDYAAAGLKGSVPLLGSGFLTEGTLPAQGADADGILTTLHYADTLDNPVNKAFRETYKAKFGKEADIYAVQGYDSAKLFLAGLEAVGGDMSKKDALIKAMEGATIDSPRGAFTISAAHNPVQDIYLREVRNGENVVVGTAAKALNDPAPGCKMATN